MRPDGRKDDEIRPVRITPDYVIYPEGSVLIEIGNTRVLCNVTIEAGIPRWMQVQGVAGGWITGEYAMLPRATHQRSQRETKGLGGRTQEIRRLIGRSLRAGVDLEKLGTRTCILDCDVLQADGGTRTAAITGGYIALAAALKKLIQQGAIPVGTLKTPIAAVSAGVIDGRPRLDLCYEEDSSAEVDINVVMEGQGGLIEVQSTAERAAFSRPMLDELLDLAGKGINELFAIQKSIIGEI